MQHRIRVGIGGWTFEPWRDNFYPPGWPHSRELEYASRQVTAIEVNGTYYGAQKPATFAKWRDEAPDDFVFSLKASRFTTNRRVLADAGESIERFVTSGIVELGPKLGPIVWQFAPTKAFDPDDFEAFLELLPARVEGTDLRHVLDVRHESFKTPAYLALARRHGIATVFTDSDDYPSFADITGDFVYTRMMRTDADLAEGCTPEALDQIARCGEVWCAGGEPDGLPRVEPPPASALPLVPALPPTPTPAPPPAPAPAPAPAVVANGAASRDVFMFFISGAKQKAPAAAMALRKRLG